MGVVFLIIAIVEALLIGAMLIFYFGTKKKQQVVVDNADSIVKGNLNVNDVSTFGLAGNDGVLAHGINSIKNNLLTFVETTKQNVVILSEAVEALNENIKNNQVGNELIANNSAEVETKTMQQLELVSDNLKIIEDNSAKMQEMVSAIEVITGMLDRTVNATQGGITSLEGYERDMEIVSADLRAVNKTVERFNDDLRQIAEVGDFIVGISNQLKLLSFNASIEAARAGQAGRGFAVVADEMTNMSEQTREGMSKINTILSSITISSSNITESIGECADKYNSSKETFDNVNASFHNISLQSIDIQAKINDISGMIKSMADNSERTRMMADDMFAGAQVINEKTGDMSAVSQEVAAEAIHIGQSTESLNGMLTGIQKLLKKFNTGIIPTEVKPTKRIKIAMFSMYDNDFWYGVKRGASYAITELSDCNAEIEFIPILPQEDTKLQDQFVADSLMRVIKEKVDGIIYPGFLGGIEHLLVRAKDEGIKLMTFNCDVDNFMLRETCVGSEPRFQGSVCAKEAIKLAPKGGKAVLLMGKPEVSGNVSRAEGFRKHLEETKALEIIDEVIVADDGDDVYQKAKIAIADKKPDIVYLTNGFPLEVAKAIVDSGAKGKTKLIGHDLNTHLIPYVKDGVIGAVVSQDAFGQGHDPIIWMYNHIVSGEEYPGEFIDCRVSITDKSNIDDRIDS